MKFIKIYLWITLLLLSSPLLALNTIQGVRIWPSPESTRIVFDLNKAVKYSIRYKTAPDRIVIDFENTKLTAKLSAVSLKNSGITNLRSGITPKKFLRIVIELENKVQVNHFALAPNDKYGDRLVIDLESNEKQKILALFDLDAKSIDPKINVALPQNFIVAIDPGHGGDDPGAIGPHGSKEKDVVLAIARRLKEALNKQPRMQAFLIRNGDYYVGFRERMNRARSKNADLLISIHADAFVNPKADGASVYILAAGKASSVAARWLAASENRADLVGGVSLNIKGDVVDSVLFDLTQTASAVASFDAAQHILHAMGNTTHLHKTTVERGAFLVLRSPDIPSLLVEAGFISNTNTELKLNDVKYQDQIAASIVQGIQSYIKNNPRHYAVKAYRAKANRVANK